MTFEDIVLKQEEVVAYIKMNWTTFWWVFLVGIIITTIIVGFCLIFTEDTIKIKWSIFGAVTGAASILLAIIAYVVSSSQIGGHKFYEIHYTVEAETFYKSEFIKDYEIISQDGRLLVIREALNE